MPCPSPTTGHRCLDCAPPARGRPFIADGLHPGNPLTPIEPGPAAQDPAAFDAHWAGVTTTRSSLTFDGAPPNHDHFVVIPDPAKPAARKAPSARTSKSAARKALLAQIPVTFA